MSKPQCQRLLTVRAVGGNAYGDRVPFQEGALWRLWRLPIIFSSARTPTMLLDFSWSTLMTILPLHTSAEGRLALCVPPLRQPVWSLGALWYLCKSKDGVVSQLWRNWGSGGDSHTRGPPVSPGPIVICRIKAGASWEIQRGGERGRQGERETEKERRRGRRKHEKGIG